MTIVYPVIVVLVILGQYKTRYIKILNQIKIHTNVQKGVQYTNFRREKKM